MGKLRFAVIPSGARNPSLFESKRDSSPKKRVRNDGIRIHFHQPPKTKSPPTRSSGGGSASIPDYKILRQIDYLTHAEQPRQQQRQRNFFNGWTTSRMLFRLPEGLMPRKTKPFRASFPIYFDAALKRSVQLLLQGSFMSQTLAFHWHGSAEGKLLDMGMAVPYTFRCWTRGDLRQLAPRKKLLKSRTSTHSELFEPSPSLARRVFYLPPRASTPKQFTQHLFDYLGKAGSRYGRSFSTEMP